MIQPRAPVPEEANHVGLWDDLAALGKAGPREIHVVIYVQGQSLSTQVRAPRAGAQETLP